MLIPNFFLSDSSGLFYLHPSLHLSPMNVLDILLILLVIFWIGGFSFHIGGDLIHILLVVALVLLILRLIGSRGTPTV